MSLSKYELNREKHKENEYTIKSALLQVKCTNSEYLLSGLIEVIIILLPVFYYYIVNMDNQNLSDEKLIVILFVIFMGSMMLYAFIIIPIFNGQSIGKRVLGLRAVKINTGKLMKIGDMGKQMNKGFKMGAAHSKGYLMYKGFKDINQSVNMKDSGVIVVKYRLYKMFKEDYLDKE